MEIVRTEKTLNLLAESARLVSAFFHRSFLMIQQNIFSMNNTKDCQSIFLLLTAAGSKQLQANASQHCTTDGLHTFVLKMVQKTDSHFLPFRY